MNMETYFLTGKKKYIYINNEYLILYLNLKELKHD